MTAPRPAAAAMARCIHGCSVHSTGPATASDPFPARLITPTSGRSAVSLTTLAAQLRDLSDAPCACVEAWVAAELEEEPHGTCDSCGRNPAIEHRDATAAAPEGSFCRTCLASCAAHWCHPSECGCPIEIRCVSCDAPMATIRAGEPEPPTVCEGCRRASASLAETLPAPAGEERAS